jgi:hypothetical protein
MAFKYTRMCDVRHFREVDCDTDDYLMFAVFRKKSLMGKDLISGS